MTSRPWTPAEIDSRLSWFVADDPEACAFFHEDGSVGAFRDRDGGVYSPLDSYVTSSRALAGDFNGRRILTTNGSDRAIGGILRPAFSAFSGKTGVSIAMAFRQNAPAENAWRALLSIQLSGGTVVADSILSLARLDPVGATSARLLYQGLKTTLSDANQAVRYLTATSIGVTDWGVVSCVLDHASGTARVRYGNATATLTIPTGQMDGAGLVYPIFIGGLRANYVRNFAMDLAEFVILDEALSDEDMDRVEGYLAHAWGIQDSLSEDHPYALAPPTVEVPDPPGPPLPPPWPGQPEEDGVVDLIGADEGTIMVRLGQSGRLVLVPAADGGLARDPTLASVVLVSLFSDARLDADQAESLEIADRRGWWADATDPADGVWGSQLWALGRMKPTPETARLAELWVRQSLQWLVDDGIAESVVAVATWVTRSGNARLELRITTTQSPAAATRYGATWEATYAL